MLSALSTAGDKGSGICVAWPVCRSVDLIFPFSHEFGLEFAGRRRASVLDCFVSSLQTASG